MALQIKTLKANGLPQTLPPPYAHSTEHRGMAAEMPFVNALPPFALLAGAAHLMLDLQMVAAHTSRPSRQPQSSTRCLTRTSSQRVEAVISHLGDPARSANDRVAPFITIGLIDRIDYYLNGRTWPLTELCRSLPTVCSSASSCTSSSSRPTTPTSSSNFSGTRSRGAGGVARTVRMYAIC